MNRRSFVKTLLALPAVGAVVAMVKPKKASPRSWYMLDWKYEDADLIDWSKYPIADDTFWSQGCNWCDEYRPAKGDTVYFNTVGGKGRIP